MRGRRRSSHSRTTHPHHHHHHHAPSHPPTHPSFRLFLLLLLLQLQLLLLLLLLSWQGVVFPINLRPDGVVHLCPHSSSKLLLWHRRPQPKRDTWRLSL